MEFRNCALGLTDLETADRLARAADLWLRHQATVGDLGQTSSRHARAAGLISGLCVAFELGGQSALLAAYAFGLLNDESEEVFAVAAAVLNASGSVTVGPAFEHGQAIAVDLIAALGLRDSMGRQPQSFAGITQIFQA